MELILRKTLSRYSSGQVDAAGELYAGSSGHFTFSVEKVVFRDSPGVFRPVNTALVAYAFFRHKNAPNWAFPEISTEKSRFDLDEAELIFRENHTRYSSGRAGAAGELYAGSIGHFTFSVERVIFRGSAAVCRPGNSSRRACAFSPQKRAELGISENAQKSIQIQPGRKWSSFCGKLSVGIRAGR